jgi:hypothetical protein
MAAGSHTTRSAKRRPRAALETTLARTSRNCREGHFRKALELARAVIHAPRAGAVERCEAAYTALHASLRLGDLADAASYLTIFQTYANQLPRGHWLAEDLSVPARTPHHTQEEDTAWPLMTGRPELALRRALHLNRRGNWFQAALRAQQALLSPRASTRQRAAACVALSYSCAKLGATSAARQFLRNFDRYREQMGPMEWLVTPRSRLTHALAR